jgi:hypothetical protein
MGSFSSKNEVDKGCVNNGSIPGEHAVILQCTRKNLLLKQFNEYIKNTDQCSVYHKHYVNTRKIESLFGITKEYKVMSTIFFTLWEIDITKYENENIVEWIN